MISKSVIVARYAETDQMGIIHHSVYPVWYEVARTDYIKLVGMSYSEMEQSGVMLPLVGLTCNYKQAVKYEDEIVVEVVISQLTPIRVEFSYTLYRKGESKPVHFGTTTHVWTDATTFKPINLKKHHPELYAKMEWAMQG